MDQTVQIQFADKMLSFDTFLSAIRNVVKEEVCKAVGKRPFVSLSKAYGTYGRHNVDRWVRQGLVHPKWRGKDGKRTRCDMPIAELEACACKVQDYLNPS